MMEQTLILKNKITEVALLPEFIEGICETLGLAADRAFNLNLALEEAVTNIISYAFPDGGEHTFALHAQSKDRVLTFTLEDDGVPFDPTEAPDVDTTLSAEERQIGGLGIFLIRQIMSSVSYEYRDGKNRLTMTLQISE